MQTYTKGRNLYGTLTDNDASSNLTIGDILINASIRKALTANGGKWWFLEKETTQDTVNGQESYVIPQSTRKIIDLYVTVGSTVYSPVAVESPEMWKRVKQMQLGTGDRTLFYYRRGNKVLLAPIPGSDGNTITIRVRKEFADLRNADYTDGTVSVSAEGTTVTGSGTTFTEAMVGRFINFTAGDGQWYEIGDYTSATSITLVAPYEGATIAASNYTIGETSPLPISYQEMPIYEAASIYWAKEDKARSDRFAAYAKGLFDAMVEGEGEKVEGAYIPPTNQFIFRDPNNPEPTVPTSSFI